MNRVWNRLRSVQAVRNILVATADWPLASFLKSASYYMLTEISPFSSLALHEECGRGL